MVNSLRFCPTALGSTRGSAPSWVMDDDDNEDEIPVEWVVSDIVRGESVCVWWWMDLSSRARARGCTDTDHSKIAQHDHGTIVTHK